MRGGIELLSCYVHVLMPTNYLNVAKEVSWTPATLVVWVRFLFPLLNESSLQAIYGLSLMKKDCSVNISIGEVNM